MILRILGFFFVASALVLVAISIYLAQTDLKLGERIGEGIFYLKGHYEKTETVGGKTQTVVVTEQGIGYVVIPLFAGFVLTFLYGLLLWSRSPKRRRTKSG